MPILPSVGLCSTYILPPPPSTNAPAYMRQKTPCRLVYVCRRFGETYCAHTVKRRCLFTKLQVVVSKRAVILEMCLGQIGHDANWVEVAQDRSTVTGFQYRRVSCSGPPAAHSLNVTRGH